MERDLTSRTKQEMPQLSQTKRELEDKLKDYNKWNLKYRNKRVFGSNTELPESQNLEEHLKDDEELQVKVPEENEFERAHNHY